MLGSIAYLYIDALSDIVRVIMQTVVIRLYIVFREIQELREKSPKKDLYGLG